MLKNAAWVVSLIFVFLLAVLAVRLDRPAPTTKQAKTAVKAAAVISPPDSETMEASEVVSVDRDPDFGKVYYQGKVDSVDTEVIEGDLIQLEVHSNGHYVEVVAPMVCRYHKGQVVTFTPFWITSEGQHIFFTFCGALKAPKKNQKPRQSSGFYFTFIIQPLLGKLLQHQ